MTQSIPLLDDSFPAIDVSIVMPCLNEAQSLAGCIANAKEALTMMNAQLGLRGEIIIADNGSTDGSQLLARALGARVVDVDRRGYGAALIGGFKSASGRYLVMGDADGSYDFREATEMVRKLVDGADICMGSRFKGGIAPRAMPWKNRYIGNPVLTFVLNLFFRTNVSDAHCGIRALRRECFDRLALTGSGMELASEMIIKAALKGERITEAPATLSRDTRDRPPHLRPWRDGWRHLRYLIMLSPLWAFAIPAFLVAIFSLFIWAGAGLALLKGSWETSFFGNYWIVLAGSLLGLSHTGLLFAASSYMYSQRAGYRLSRGRGERLSKWINLETMLISGGVLMAAGLSIMTTIFLYWSGNNHSAVRSVYYPVIGATLLAIGAQNALGGILLAIINGNEAAFLNKNSALIGEPHPTPSKLSSSRPESGSLIDGVHANEIQANNVNNRLASH